jgi:hypothetical protein
MNFNPDTNNSTLCIRYKYNRYSVILYNLINRLLSREFVILCDRQKSAMILSFCILSLLTAGSLGLPLAASVVSSNTLASTSGSTVCLPMMSNVTVPSMTRNVLPPKMYIIYGDKILPGELSQSKYREGETFSELNISPESIKSELPVDTLQMRKDTCVQFIVKGTPKTLPPNSLDVTAYNINGTTFGVLDPADDNTSTFRVNLPRGAYILLATATWIPSSTNEYVTGYVIYKFVAKVTEN